MKKILHVCNAFPTTENIDYGIFIKEQIETLIVQSDAFSHTVLFINARELGTLEYIRVIRKLRKMNDFDIYHCHHLYSAYSAVLAGIPFSKIVVSFLNDYTKEIKLPLPEKFKEYLCDYVIRNSEKVIFKSEIPEKFCNDKSVVNIPNGVDTQLMKLVSRNDAKVRLGLSADLRYILFVSSKYLERPQKRKDLYDQVISIIKSYPAYNNCEALYASNVDRQTMVDIFNAADIHLLTSDYEGSPNSVKEALACGTSVVARNVGNVYSMAQEFGGIFVVETSNPKDIADAVIRVLDNLPNREYVRTKFCEGSLTRDNVAKRIIELYHDI